MENLINQPADTLSPIFCRFDSLDNKPQISFTSDALHNSTASVLRQTTSTQSATASPVALVSVMQPISPTSTEPISHLSLWHEPSAKTQDYSTALELVPSTTALREAICSNDLPTVETLLEAKVSLKPEHWYDTPLLVLAAKHGYNDIVQALLNAGDDPNKGYLRLPLHVAAEHGHLETVQRLLNSGAQIRAKEEEGQTALMRAAAGGHLAIVQVLIDKGANIDAICQGETALMLASQNGHRQVYEFLYPYVRARGMLVEEQARQQQAIFSAEAAHFDSELTDLFGSDKLV